MAKRSSGGKGGWWSLVVLAGAGLAAAGMLKKRSELKRATRRALPPTRRRPVPAPEPERSLFELPEDVDSAWLPAPAGSLRVVQRHREASAAIVFVHGLGGSLEQWAPALASLPKAWRGVAFDLPGHGASDGVADAGIDDFAAAIGAVVDGLGLRRVVLVGHSFGSAVVARYAGHRRHRVAGVLLVDPNGDQTKLPEEDRRKLLATVRRDAHGELTDHFSQVLGEPPGEIKKRILVALASTPEDVLYDGLRAGLSYSPVPDIDRFAGPIRLVLSPLNDLPFGLQRLRPQLRSATIRKVGHWLMLERPQEFAELLDQFLDVVGDRVDRVH